MEREETAARAKLKVYEQAMQEGTDVDCSIPIEVEDPMEHTSQYVLKHNVCNNAEPSSVLPTNNAVLTHHRDPRTTKACTSSTPQVRQLYFLRTSETPELQRPAPLQHHNTSASTVLPTNITETPELQKPAPPQHYNAGASTVLPTNSTQIQPAPLQCHNTSAPTLQTASPLANDNVTSSNQ
ncbi:uncharacterized protein M6D78_009958 [Vipera latastei]